MSGTVMIFMWCSLPLFIYILVGLAEASGAFPSEAYSVKLDAARSAGPAAASGALPSEASGRRVLRHGIDAGWVFPWSFESKFFSFHLP